MKAVLCLLSFIVACAYGFKYNLCAGTDNSNAEIRKLTVTPSPVAFPGTVSWEFEGELKKPVKSVSMSVELIKNTFILDVTLPCVQNIGSCSYQEMCSFVDDMVRENWGGIGAKIGNQLNEKSGGKFLNNADLCTNGLAPQVFKTAKSIQVPALPSVLSFIAAGDYTVRVKLTDNSDKSNIICVEAKVQFEKADGGSFWGKRRRSSA